jgi:hypothetical protein
MPTSIHEMVPKALADWAAGSPLCQCISQTELLPVHRNESSNPMLDARDKEAAVALA